MYKCYKKDQKSNVTDQSNNQLTTTIDLPNLNSLNPND